MAPGRDLTTEADVDAAMARSAQMPELPLAISAEYYREMDLIALRLNNGRRLVIPREDLQGLDAATPEQIAYIEIFGGLDIAWPDLDLDHYLPSLMKGEFGSERWMQSLEQRKVAA